MTKQRAELKIAATESWDTQSTSQRQFIRLAAEIGECQFYETIPTHVKIPIGFPPRFRYADKLWNRGVRRYPDVPLMMKLIPKFIPNRFAGFHLNQRFGGVIRYAIAALEFAPNWISE